MTVEWWRYAQSLTDRPMKGMLTGPAKAGPDSGDGAQASMSKADGKTRDRRHDGFLRKAKHQG
jgi:methionine synthase II (cobalamin-independent)